MEEEADIHIGKVDCTENSKTCGLMGIQGYPTLKLIDGDVVYNFLGDRSLNFLKTFVTRDFRGAPKEALPAMPTPPATGRRVGGTAETQKMIKDSKMPQVILTEQNFADLTSSGRWLVAATAGWCGHCKALQPTLDQLVAVKDSLSFEVAKIDCDDDGVLCQLLGVKSFPHILVIEGGYMYRYQGDRSLDSLKAFGTQGYADVESQWVPGQKKSETLQKRSGMSLLDDRTFDEATARDAWLVGYTCASAECKKLEEQLAQVQRSYSVHLRVGLVDCVKSPVICREAGITKSPSVALFYGEKAFSYPSNTFSSESLVRFVSEGFKDAPSRTRKHLGFVRRLSLQNLFSLEALEDFARQQRYILVGCFVLFVFIWGIFFGSTFANSRVRIIEELKAQAKRANTAAAKKKD